jgi:serine/threonine protein kinase/Tol biopolymer transport system component
MSLQSGVRLGPYEVLSALGAGGMGEVYKARDTRLDRIVAIKILPDTLAADPEFRERFDSEARAISQLDHPHICMLYDVGEHAGTAYLVMQYLEGQTLAERLCTGPLPLDQALTIAREIAAALDKAHRAGIVHRDLKPGNIMLTKAGAKLLDFGLAKSGPQVVAGSGLSVLPTTPRGLTAQGTILGTFQYMAPEQVEGLEADARTDVFAFGALLFETLTGRPAFEGKTRASLLGAILKDEPPAVSRLQPVAPSALDRIVSTCLAKDPDDRYQSVRDLLRDLEWVASGSTQPEATTPVAIPGPPDEVNRVAWLLTALSAIALVATAGWAIRRAPDVTPAAGPIQFLILPPKDTSFGTLLGGGTGVATQLAVSPDGRHVVFVGRMESTYQLWLRPLDSLAASPIPGTDGAAFPFWSPDSRFIGFFAAGKLKKVQIAGGPPVVLCDASSGRGGTWSRDNVIVFTPNVTATGLMRVSAAGGVPTAVTSLNPATGETSHRWPHFLPDGRHFFYTATTGTCCPPSQPGAVRIASLDSPAAAVTLFHADSAVSYSSGHVLFVAPDQTLMALPFDAVTRQTTGDPFPIAEQVSYEGSRYVGASVSASGTLVYGQSSQQIVSQLTWFDRTGRVLGTVGDAAPYLNLALSPDESRVAVALATGSPTNRDIWTLDARGIPSRLTFDPAVDGSPVWSPDGTRVAFEGSRAGKASLRQRLVDRPMPEEALFESENNVIPSSWSPDGRFIAFTLAGATSSDIWALPVSAGGKPFQVVKTAFADTSGTFSPDGRWIAYASSEGGQPSIYVQPFPEALGKYQVTKDGGSHPVWRADGKELFYLAQNATLMAVPIDSTGHFRAGTPQALFPTNVTRLNAGQVYAVSKDGKRFLVNSRPQQSTDAPLIVVVNWPATIQK